MKRFVSFIFLLTLLLIPSSKSEAATLKSPTSLYSGLVGWWTFDGKDMWGGVVRDKTANANNANLFNIATSTFYSEGIIGQGGNFDGVDDYINTSLNPSTELGTTFSISAWVKPTAVGNYKGIAGDHPSNNGIVFGQYDTGSWTFAIGSGTGFTTVVTGIQMTLNQWTHLTMVARAGVGIEVFKNGVSAGSDFDGGTVSNTTTFYVGRAYNGTNRYFQGTIDDVRVYNRALSANEVNQLYKAGASKIAESKSLGSLATGLYAHWTFDGGDMLNGVMVDKTGNSRNLAFIGIASSTFFVPGAIGQAGNFGGTSYATRGGANLINGVTEYTKSFWVYLNSYGAKVYRIMAQCGNPGTNCVSTNMLSTNIGTTGTVSEEFSPGGVYCTTGAPSNTIPLKTWTHISVVRSGATVKIYFNGALALTYSSCNSGALSSSLSFVLSTQETNSLYINGALDDVRMYSRALTDAEVARLYDLGTVNKISATVANKGNLASGLISHWTFDGKDMWGGVARDKIGDSDANLNNIATSTFYVSGKIGQAGNFDGVDDFASTTAHTTLNGASQFTIAGWAKMRTAASRGSIFSRWTSGTNWINLQFWTSNTVNIIVANTATTYGTFSTTGSLDRTQWTHYVMVFDGTQTGNANRLKLYANGSEIALSYTGTIPATAPTMTNNDRIGYDTHNALSFDGALDDVRIYNRALSANEVSALYNLGR